MGSGSFGGGGGGGGGGSSGGGGGGGGMRGYSFHGGRGETAASSETKARRTVRDTFAKLSRDSKNYLAGQFCSPMVRRVFEQLFLLPSPVFRDQRWELVARQMGTGSGPGCLHEWVEKVVAEAAGEEPNPKVRETARMCLEDFLITSLDDDIDVYLSGDGQAVVKKLKEDVFKSTSGYFLGALVWRVLEREVETLPQDSEIQLRRASQVVADHLVREFESKFKTGQITHRQIFRVFQENPEWLIGELRK